MTKQEEVLDFLKRRFSKDSDWTSGNCYYMAIILKKRFPCAKIYYDVILGHFIVKIKGVYYDANGVFDANKKTLIRWGIPFLLYDDLWFKRVIRDVIK